MLIALSISARIAPASGRQSVSSSTTHLDNNPPASRMNGPSGKSRSKSNSGFFQYQKRRNGLPETIDHRTLPRVNTSNVGLTFSSLIPTAHGGIQSRVPTFSSVAESLVR